MNLSDTIILLLGCVGLTVVIVHAEVLDLLKIRPFLNKWEFTRKLIKCSLCTGAWVSLIIGLLYVKLLLLLPFIFAGAIASFFIERTVILVDELVMKYEHDRRNRTDK
jgi:pheromone shutdown protein TraB